MSLLDERGQRYMRTAANRGAARRPATAAEVRGRRDLYWLGLHEVGGLSQAAIADQSGYTQQAVSLGIARARRLARSLSRTGAAD